MPKGFRSCTFKECVSRKERVVEDWSVLGNYCTISAVNAA